MKREERNLDGKRDEEPKEQPLGRRRETFHMSAANGVLNLHKIKTAGFAVEPDNGPQHKHGGNHREQEILNGRVDAPSVAVHADQQRHWDECCFPEKVEQEQVE